MYIFTVAKMNNVLQRTLPSNGKIVQNFLYLFVLLVHLCSALYEDQIGKFDWRQQYIGKVKFAYIDPSVAGVHKFHLATEENVLACLSTRTGSIMWRQVFEKGKDGYIDALSEDGGLITVNGRGKFIRSWDPSTGVLLWETSFPNINSGGNSDLKFHIDNDEKEIIMVEMQRKLYAKVSIYSYTRASMKTSDHIKGTFIEPENCKFLSSQYFLCLDVRGESLNLLSLRNSGSFITVPLKSFGIEVSKSLSTMKIVPLPHQLSSGKPFFALQLDSDFVLFQIQPPGIGLKKIFPSVYALTSTIVDKSLVLFLLSPTAENNFRVLAMEPETDSEINNLEGSLNIPTEYGQMENVFVLPYAKKDQNTSYKLLLSTADHAVLLIHQQSRLIWSREEALANIVSVEILDLPLSETDANIEQEFGDLDASLIAMLYTRLKSQIYLLETFFHQSLAELQHNTHNFGIDSESNLSRDTFGLHKIIVVVTRPGKFFGIDNLSGQIVWSHFERELIPFSINDQLHFPVFVQRTTAHFPYPPQCTVLGKNKSSAKNHLFSFNPITGKVISSQILDYDILQVISVGLTDIQYLRGIVLLDSNLTVHVYPESAKSVLVEHNDYHFIVIANSTEGSLVGYSVDIDDNKDLFANAVWKIQLPNEIISVSLKRPFEHVHSQGRVMGDRSVLYKYLNPNLAAVFTEGSDATQKTFCNIYLIDTVTGLVVYSASHKKCKRPIKVVHSENWVVYSYYNDKSRRVEVSSIELFEGVSQSNTTAFTSFSPPPPPLVEHQSFIFPSPIEAMVDTVTERGLTNKHILIALPTGGILELPKSFLDPRRPITPLPEHREEGLIPYLPELPIMSDRLINYNQSVMRIHGIQMAPSNLESTCLVFAYGLDLFYTRVTPSKTFDILKDDFDHYLITAVLIGLLMLSYVTKRLAARKSLKAAWK